MLHWWGEDPYADRTYVCNVELHQNKGSSSFARVKLFNPDPCLSTDRSKRFLCYSSALFVRRWFNMWRLFCHCLCLVSPSSGYSGSLWCVIVWKQCVTIGIKHGFQALTFAGSPGRCWNPRPKATVFNTSQGTWRMLMLWKTMFDRYYCIKTKNIATFRVICSTTLFRLFTDVSRT